LLEQLEENLGATEVNLLEEEPAAYDGVCLRIRSIGLFYGKRELLFTLKA